MLLHAELSMLCLHAELDLRCHCPCIQLCVPHKPKHETLQPLNPPVIPPLDPPAPSGPPTTASWRPAATTTLS